MPAAHQQLAGWKSQLLDRGDCTPCGRAGPGLPHPHPGEGSSSPPQPHGAGAPTGMRGGRDVAVCLSHRQGTGSSVIFLLTNVFVSSHRGIDTGPLYDVAVSTTPQCQAAAPWTMDRFINICVRTSPRLCAATGKNHLWKLWADGDAPVTCTLPSAPGSVKAY